MSKDPAIERELRRAEMRWRWLRIGVGLGIFGIASCGLLVGFGYALLAGWITEMVLAQVLLGLLVFGLVIAGLGVLVIMATGALPRRTLADKIEDVNPPMLDRLNTLVAYEKKKHTVEERSFLNRISDQARATIQTTRTRRPFTGLAALLWLGGFALAIVLCAVFWQQAKPWSVLAKRLEIQKATEMEVLPELDLSDPQANVSEFSSVWGDVRISEPGKDLKLTKVDVVPLQIEAASNQALKSAHWTSSVNGGEDTVHPLEAPAEPNYAAYQPTIYLDEYNLSDWDVLAYYASAQATNDDTFSSDIYFVEIRPFREDIIKQLGGGGGQEGESESYDIVSLLTGLIDRQREILRETHRFHQKPASSPDVKEQDRKKLSDAEAELSLSTTNAYAHIAAMENKNTGEALDHLGKAEGFMTKAVGALDDNSPEDAAQYEFSALSELVATRKIIQKIYSDEQQDGKDSPEEQDPIADGKPKQQQIKDVKDVAEYRDREKSAQSQMNDLVNEQKKLSDQASKGGNSKQQQQKMGEKQRDLQKELDQMQQDFPEMFDGMQDQTQEAKEAMSKSASTMEKGKPSQQDAQRAMDKLNDLQSSMENQQERRDLQHAYELKRELDQQINQLDQMSQKPEGPSPQEQKQAAQDAKSTMEQMKEIADSQPKGLGDQLQKSMQGEQQEQREQAMDQLGQGKQGEEGKQAAANARDSLKELSQSFEKSQPETMAKTREKDPLGPGTPEEQLDRGEKQLNSLSKRLEDNKPPSPEELEKQMQEIHDNLKGGAEGNPDVQKQLADVFDKMDMKGNGKAKELTPEQIRELLAQLEALRVELSEGKSEDGKADLTHLNPEKWPAQYRDRIQKYFEKLSEQ